MIAPPYPARLRSTTARGALFAAFALAFQASGTAQEAPAEPPDIAYTAEVAAPDSDALAALGTAIAQTVTLRERAPTDAFGLIGRVRADLPRLQEALRAEGYWGGSVGATIAGRPVDDPALPALLQAATAPVPVVLTLTPGPQYRIGHVTVTAEPASEAAVVEAAARDSGLAEGDPARSAAVAAAEDAMTAALRNSGHPLPRIAGREIWVDHDRKAMDIAWRIAPGPVATFARPAVTGEVRTHAGLLERTAARQIEGRAYSPATLEGGRRALVSLGVFDSVRAEPASELAPGNRLPVTFHVSERPLRAIGGTLSWETNYGLGISAYWEHRNLFGGAERLRLEAEASRLTETDAADATYRAFATLTVPEILGYDARLISRIGAVREMLDAYDREAVIASALAEHALSPRLAVRAGPTFETGRIGRDGDLDPYSLIGFVGGLRWDGTTSLLNPTSGQRATITATPYWSIEDGSTFTRILATGSTYFDLTGNGGSVLALRASVGSVVGASFDRILLDKRFYAGGGGSVRGYTYQSIGPRDAQNRPLGGASLLELSAEWRQRISGPWGAVAFVDGGSVSEDTMPGSGTMRIGVGGGLRYLTAIGPIRVDIGMPLNPQTGDAAYALYVGIGQAF